MAPQANHTQRGAAILEAAVSLGLFLALLFGIIEVARVWMTYHLLTVAVREGARLAVVTPDLATGDTRVIDRMNELLLAGGVTGVDPSVTINQNQQVTVRAEITHTPFTRLAFINSIPLDVQVVARRE